jgi:enoyl-CoA hydratase/carnithine racemase
MSEVLYQKFDGYAVFTLNRPEVLNAMNTALREQFTDCMDDFEADPAMRVGIVTGAGRGFGTGADLKEAALGGEGGGNERAARAHAGQFGRSKKVFIAAVNGPCIAGSFEWTLDMDIRICAPEAYFGLFEVSRGRLAGFGLERLPRMVPFGEAMWILVTGQRIDAEQALRCGLVHEVVEQSRLVPRATEIAQMILANHPLAVEGARAIARHALENDSDDARRLVSLVRRVVRRPEDVLEGSRAFAEKRQAAFTDS